MYTMVEIIEKGDELRKQINPIVDQVAVLHVNKNFILPKDRRKAYKLYKKMLNDILFPQKL